MENQTEQRQYTEAEIKENLKNAIELQTLQTELQELRTKMLTSRANEIYAIRQINEMMSAEKEAQVQNTPTSPTQTVTPSTTEARTPFAESKL